MYHAPLDRHKINNSNLSTLKIQVLQKANSHLSYCFIKIDINNKFNKLDINSPDGSIFNKFLH